MKKPRWKTLRPPVASPRFTYRKAKGVGEAYEAADRLAFFDGRRVMFTAVVDRERAQQYVWRMNRLRDQDMNTDGRKTTSKFIAACEDVRDVDDPLKRKRKQLTPEPGD